MDERNPIKRPTSNDIWAMVCHLSALIGYIIPFGNIIAPLVIWLVKRNQSEYINQQGKEAVNFQITISLLAILCLLLYIIIIGLILWPLIALANLILIIMAAIATYKGENYKYPFSLRLIK